MQHPEAGLIHAWLDGQLPADEAAQLEAHLAECPACAASAAEARGLVAGAARILIALDDAPRGVVPIAPRKTRPIAPLLKAAAILLVVATGGTLVLRSRENEKPAAAATIAAAPSRPESPSAASDEAPIRRVATAPPAAVPRPSVQSSNKALSVTSAGSAVASAMPASGPMAKVTPAMPAPQLVQMARGSDTAIDIVMTRDKLQLQSAVVTGAATTISTSLKIARDERIAGGRRITYEVGPGQLVSLTDVEPSSGDTVGATAVSPPQPRSVYGPRASMEPEPSTHQIHWTDKATGRVLTLSGRFPEADLERIRRLIEIERSRAK